MSARSIEILYTPYCPIGLTWVRDLATRLRCGLVEYNIWELRPEELPGLPQHLRCWVERAWSGEGGFGPYSPVFFAGRYYDLDSLDRLEDDIRHGRGEPAGGASGMAGQPGNSGGNQDGNGKKEETQNEHQGRNQFDSKSTPNIAIRLLADPVEIRCQFELGAGQTWPERKAGGPLAFCGHHLLPCKTALWADLTRRYGAMGLLASLDGRECGMVTFAPKPVARRLGWATSPDDRDLERTLSVVCLVVQPYARGQGVAKALVRALADYARDTGYRRVEAATTSSELTPPDRYGWQTTRLFTGQGWRVVPGAGAPWLPVMVARQL